MSYRAFDPSDWLDRWEAAGGGWYVIDGGPRLCHLEGAKIADLLIETYVPGRGDAVFAVILQRHAAKEMTAAE
jgi:hypothetical protein